jgi:hypothetical protein
MSFLPHNFEQYDKKTNSPWFLLEARILRHWIREIELLSNFCPSCTRRKYQLKSILLCPLIKIKLIKPLQTSTQAKATRGLQWYFFVTCLKIIVHCFVFFPRLLPLLQFCGVTFPLASPIMLVHKCKRVDISLNELMVPIFKPNCITG